jgi:hypothetical protein
MHRLVPVDVASTTVAAGCVAPDGWVPKEPRGPTACLPEGPMSILYYDLPVDDRFLLAP